jgi:hypothetical protein
MMRTPKTIASANKNSLSALSVTLRVDLSSSESMSDATADGCEPGIVLKFMYGIWPVIRSRQTIVTEGS